MSKEVSKKPTTVYKTYISGKDYPNDIILKRIRRQNKGLKTTEWDCIKRIPTPNGTIFILRLDLQSIEYIKNRNFLLFCGMTQIKFDPRVHGKKRNKQNKPCEKTTTVVNSNFKFS